MVNTEGISIKSTMDHPTTTQYTICQPHARLHLEGMSTMHETDTQSDLTFLRIHAKKNEIMVAPDKDYFLVVIKDPTK
ncbi:hypothetical protein ACRRTK_019352 [Alexandromys fortis]